MAAVDLKTVDAATLRRAVRALDDPPSAPGWNASELADLLDSDLPLRTAAVLVPLVRRGEEFFVLFTVRTDQMREHAGQVSFPGGRIEAKDFDAVAAALRETEEETGIQSNAIEAFGYLDALETVSGFRVLPVAGFVDGSYQAAPDGTEVAELFEVPLAFILAPGRLKSQRVEWRGRKRNLVEFDWMRHRVWGATASILVNLARRLELVT